MIPFEVWLVWVIIGIVAGYMTSKLLLDGSYLWAQCLVGVIGAIVGGWTFLSLLNVSPEAFTKWAYVSLLVSGVGAAILLWPLVVWLKNRSNDSPDDSDEA